MKPVNTPHSAHSLWLVGDQGVHLPAVPLLQGYFPFRPLHGDQRGKCSSASLSLQKQLLGFPKVGYVSSHSRVQIWTGEVKRLNVQSEVVF